MFLTGLNVKKTERFKANAKLADCNIDARPSTDLYQGENK